MRKKKISKRILRTHRKRTRKVGVAPGTLIEPGEATPTQIRAMVYGPDALEEKPVENPKDLESLLGGQPVVWVSVAGLKDIHLIRELGEIFDLHPLMLEDIVNGNQYPKIEDYHSNLFVVTHAARSRGDEIVLEQISMVLGKGFVISFEESAGELWSPVRTRIRQGSGGRVRLSRPDYLLYALLDVVVDTYFPILDHLADRLDVYENEVIQNPRRELIDLNHGLKRDFLSLRRAIWPLRDVFKALLHEEDIFSEDTRLFLRDCHDHTLQMIDILGAYNERASDLINIYLTSISNKMNEVMKILTIIATMFMPMGVIAGIYGMNFDTAKSPYNMPELGWYFGYPFALGLMALAAVLFLIFFTRLGWLRGHFQIPIDNGSPGDSRPS